MFVLINLPKWMISFDLFIIFVDFNCLAYDYLCKSSYSHIRVLMEGAVIYLYHLFTFLSFHSLSLFDIPVKNLQ